MNSITMSVANPHSGTASQQGLVQAQATLEDTGFVHLRGVLPAALCATWRGLLITGFAQAADHPASLRLSQVAGLDVDAVWQGVGAVLGPLCETRLGTPLLCDVDECWLRRQGGPTLAPHSWHQDGALRFDFAAHPVPAEVPEAVLPMLTCWIALTPCGRDAPGLELMARREPHLWSPAQLARVPDPAAAEGVVRPVMAAGDVLVFGGDTLHRTHTTPAMQAMRISLELRLFAGPALPARLHGDQALPLPRLRGVGSVE